MLKYAMPLLVLCCFVGGVLDAHGVDCDKVVDYKMNVQLNPDEKTVTGSERLIWKNTSDKPVSDLYFHAYLNAFKNSSSSYYQEALNGKAKRIPELTNRAEHEWGYLDVQSISVQGENESLIPLNSTMRYEQPDDENKFDQTVFVVSLPEPVLPDQNVTLVISFVSKLPHNAPRTGYVNDFYFVAQWFPKIGVLVEGEWNCHQFHRSTEFFADFGSYDVSITVPSSFVVGATGVMMDSTDHNGDSITYRFQQDCIHDFAWTASQDYKVAKKVFKNDDLPNVEMRLLYQPGHEKFVEDYFIATENTLKYYGLWYVPYPYSNITIVEPNFKSKACGMEYPTLFTTCADWLEPDKAIDRHSLTIHECGHQFWYGLVANNEFEFPWLDEGINSYADVRCLDAAEYERFHMAFYLKRNGFQIPYLFSDIPITSLTRRIERYRKYTGKDVINKPGWDFLDAGSYKINAYDKPALMFMTLEAYLGEETFSQIMKTYAERFLFKHPTPQDFINTVNEFSPEPMDWFFDQVLESSGILDYAVTKVESAPAHHKIGFYDNDSKRSFINEKSENKEEFESRITIQRLGEIQIPVDIRITFENGETMNDIWDGKDLWKRYHFVRDSQVIRVDVDPDKKLALDYNYTNNSLYRTRSNTAALRWTVKWMYWIQHLFEIAAFFS